ncbi:phage tail tape measure protein [Pseudonocardia sp. NPDC049154]|uniref:phage tail tape measure protein n=1 Tax=Pseudonocardia sp. NPDC049154 TaxID=3155501 RepID=UPI0034107081
MAGNGPTIRLTFAGDSTDLERAMSRVGDSAGQMEKQFSVKSAGLAVAGAAAGAGLSAAFAESLEFDSAAAKLEAQMGAGSQAAKDAGEIAGNLYSSAYGDSLDQVGEAVRMVMQSGAVMEDATNEQIQGITANVLSLSEAFGQDLAGTTNAVAQMMRTGLAPDAQTALDILTAGFQNGADKAGDLLDTFNEYGTQFRKVGLDGAAAMGLISQGLQAGARDADIVADAIKEFSIRAVDGSKTTIDGFTALGLSAEDMAAKIAAGGPTASAALDTVLDRLRGVQDPTEQARIAVELFGTQAEDLGAALYALDPSEATARLGEFGGAAQGVNDTLQDTAANKIEEAKRGFQDLMFSVVGVQGPVGDVAAKVVGLGGDAVTMAGSLGMAAVAFRGLGIASGIATAAQWLWNAALSANPIGLVVLAIAGLVAGLIWAYNNVGWFRDGVNAAFGAVRNFIGGAVDWISGKWSGLMGWFRGLPGQIGGIFSSVGGAISGAFRSAFNFVADLWNYTIGRLSFNIPDWIPGIGGRGFSMPKLPKFHTGGVVPGAQGQEMLAVLQAGERVIPTDRSGNGGGTTMTFRGNTSDALATVIQHMIRTGQIEVAAR